MDPKLFALAAGFLLSLSVRPVEAGARANGGVKDTVPGRLLYIVEGEKNFMIPYIERKLKNLRKADADTLLYDSVASLNSLTQSASIEIKLIDNFNELYSGTYKAETPAKQQSVREHFSYYSQFVRTFQSVLTIKVTPFEELIEFQFSLYDVGGGGRSLHYRNSSSVFIDPRSPHYQIGIISTLNQVFERANRQPVVHMTTNVTRIHHTYFLSSGDSLKLEPIIDDESAEEDRIYFWREDGGDTIRRVHLEATRKNQYLYNLGPGNYTLYFRTSNGITYSKYDTLLLSVYEKPNLSVRRPNDETFFGAFPDRLIIQEYIPGGKEIDYFSKYLVTMDHGSFGGSSSQLLVKITDKKGIPFVSDTFPPPDHPNEGISLNSNRRNAIIPEVDSLELPSRSSTSTRYIISFVAKSPTQESSELKHELRVFQRRGVSIVYDAMISPLPQNSLFHSWLNVSAGLDLHMNDFILLTALFGTNTANKSFAHYYSTFIASLIVPKTGLEGGPAIWVNHDDGSVSLGFKISYRVFRGGRSDSKVGISYFNMGDDDINAVHYTGNIFFIH